MTTSPYRFASSTAFTGIAVLALAVSLAVAKLTPTKGLTTISDFVALFCGYALVPACGVLGVIFAVVTFLRRHNRGYLIEAIASAACLGTFLLFSPL